MIGATLQHAIPMDAREKSFYVQLGRRIAELRKAADITQTELAEILGVAQQTMAHYEGGVSRIAVSLLPPLARTLSTTVEELIGEDIRRSSKRGPASRLQQQLDQVSQLPKAKQKFVSEMLDTVLQQASR